MARRANGFMYNNKTFFTLKDDFKTWEKLVTNETKAQLLEDIQKLRINFSSLVDQMNGNLKRNYGMVGAVNYSGANLEVRSTKYGESIFNVEVKDIKEKEDVGDIASLYKEVKIDPVINDEFHSYKKKRVKTVERVKRKNFFFCKKMKLKLENTVKLYDNQFKITISRNMEELNREMLDEFYLN